MTGQADQSWRKRLELPFLLLLVLAVTIPFLGQAVQADAHQFIDWAKLELDHPLWQHLPDYDYFGINYPGNSYHDTHPRLHSLYLSMWLRITGGNLSEWLLHLEVIIFPAIAAAFMYLLARRFKVNAFIATLLFVISPAFLVNSQLIMIDVPGVAFWLAAMYLYIRGVDENRIIYLVTSTVFLTLGIFTLYQNLSLLPLAFLYLILSRKIKARTLTPLAVPVIFFMAYFSAHYAAYGDPPNFSHYFGLPLDPSAIIDRIRGTTALLGGTLIFPLAILAIFSRFKFINYMAIGVLLISLVWSSFLYLTGSFSWDNLLLLPWLLTAAAMLALFIFRSTLAAAPDAIRRGKRKDDAILGVWFLGVLFYNYILLPYPSPRYLIALIPPAAIFTSKEIERIWGSDRRRLIIAGAVIFSSTLILSLAVAIEEHQRANNNKTVAGWVEERYPANGHVWFNGGLGFQYYLEQKGYRMALINGEGIETGDYIIESIGNNRWYFDPEFVLRLELVEEVDFPHSWPVTTEFFSHRISWLGQIGNVIPYGFEADYLDRIYVYKVVSGPEDANHPDPTLCHGFAAAMDRRCLRSRLRQVAPDHGLPGRPFRPQAHPAGRPGDIRALQFSGGPPDRLSAHRRQGSNGRWRGVDHAVHPVNHYRHLSPG